MESKRSLYQDTLPRQDFDRLCYEAAALCLLLTLLARLAERDLVVSTLDATSPRS
jgi:hypothetical protein